MSNPLQEQQSSEGSKVFTCFKRLPLELQDRVWRFQNADAPRVFQFVCDGEKWIVLSNKNAQPTISKICEVSRDSFLRDHFIITNEYWSSLLHHTNPVYVNSLMDTVLLRFWHFGKELYLSDLRRAMESFPKFVERQTRLIAGNVKRWGIKSLALNYRILEFFYICPAILELFEALPELEEVVFVQWFQMVGEVPDNRDSVIRHCPTDDMFLNVWEESMQAVGFLQQVKGYPKWSSLQISCAEFVEVTHAGARIVDNRDGLRMMGPPNKMHEKWGPWLGA